MSDTSNITPGSVDADFPVAGQDNDSQGFRENFNVIKDSLTGAAGYIAILQDDTAKTTAPNNMQGNNLLNTNFVQVSHEAQVGAVDNNTSTKTLDFEEAAHYNLTFAVDCTLQLRNASGSSSDTKFTAFNIVLRKSTSALVDPTITFDVGAGKTLFTDGNPLWASFILDNDAEHTMVEIVSFDNVNFYAKVLGTFTEVV